MAKTQVMGVRSKKDTDKFARDIQNKIKKFSRKAKR